MSNELEFVNFCISFGHRLNQITDKWRYAKELEILPEEEEQLLRAMYMIFKSGIISFGNDNRDPGEIITGK